MPEHEYTTSIIGGLLTALLAIAGGLWVGLTKRVTLSDEKLAALDVKFTKHAAESNAQQDALSGKLDRLVNSFERQYRRNSSNRTRQTDG